MELHNDILGLPDWAHSLVEYDNCVNFMKGAFETADKITTVSPTYAWEILNPYFSTRTRPRSLEQAV